MEAVRQLGVFWLLINEPPPLKGKDTATCFSEDKHPFLILGRLIISKNIWNLNLQWKLLLMVITALMAFVLYTVYESVLLARTSINGPVYKEIIMNKNLVASILPPREYVIEAHLLTLQMRSEKNRTNWKS